MQKLRERWKVDARYWLSAAGIIIGIACAVTATSLIEGGKASIYRNFGVQGLNVYEVQLKNDGFEPGRHLKSEDAKLIEKKMPEVKYAMPVLKTSGQLKSYKKSDVVEIFGTSEKYDEYMNLELVKGSFIKEADVLRESRIAVIDDITAEKLYGTTEVIGQELVISIGAEKSDFLIAGVIRNFKRNIETLFEEDIEGVCFIPETTAEGAYSEFETEKIVALVNDNLHEEEAEVKLEHILEKEYEAEGFYSAERYGQLSNVTDFVDKYLVFIIVVSVFSLLLGSIGVMNMLLLAFSVMKKEIGLYKFYGAGIKDMKYELLLKSLVVCITSGLAGMAAGLLMGDIIGSFINVNTGVTINSLALALGVSGAAGIISGIYPASKAAHVNASEVVWGE